MAFKRLQSYILRGLEATVCCVRHTFAVSPGFIVLGCLFPRVCGGRGLPKRDCGRFQGLLLPRFLFCSLSLVRLSRFLTRRLYLLCYVIVSQRSGRQGDWAESECLRQRGAPHVVPRYYDPTRRLPPRLLIPAEGGEAAQHNGSGEHHRG